MFDAAWERLLEPITLREKVQEATKKGYEDQVRVGAEWDSRKLVTP
jgi:hypothetical protein